MILYVYFKVPQNISSVRAILRFVAAVSKICSRKAPGRFSLWRIINDWESLSGRAQRAEQRPDPADSSLMINASLSPA